MSSPAGVRHRGPKDKKQSNTPNTEALQEKVSDYVEKTKREFKKQPGGEWDYKLAISIITVLAFITRFWGISYPQEVVFDEVHFGKV
jgi:dolichyl-phosphate-mannose-protein mannosyltransferase